MHANCAEYVFRLLPSILPPLLLPARLTEAAVGQCFQEGDELFGPRSADRIEGLKLLE